MQLCYFCKCDIYCAYSVPGRVVNHARLRKIEYFLELSYSLLCGLTVDSVHGNLRYVGIGVGDGVKLLLKLAHFLTGGADSQLIAGVGGGDTADFLGCVDVGGASVVVAQDFYVAVAVIAQSLASSLAHRVRAGYALAVAVLCEYRLFYIRAGDIVGKYFIDDAGYAVKDIAPIYPLVVIRR